MSKPSSRPSPIKAQDEPFNLDAVEKEGSKQDYRFILGDREWVMRPMGRLDKKAMKRMAKLVAGEQLDNVEYMDEMLKAAMGEEQFAEFDDLPLSMDGLTQLFENWSDHSGIDPGESQASTGS